VGSNPTPSAPIENDAPFSNVVEGGVNVGQRSVVTQVRTSQSDPHAGKVGCQHRDVARV
jgi:hypothetical protein